MPNLEQITIKVSSEIAQLYRQFSKEEQEEIEKKINKVLALELEKRRQKAIQELSNLMDKASEEAEANGLTPEILEEILADE